MKALKVGTPAPEFELNATPDQRVKLSEFRGQRVILAFYPADWSPVCGDQLALYNELREEFAKHNAVCVGISVDGAWCHAAFREQRGYKLALLSDFEPKGAVARDYNVFDMQRFTDDMDSRRFVSRVREDFMSAVRSGAAGTPSFFINGEPYEGSHDDEALIEALRFAARAHAAHATKEHQVQQ